MKLTTENGSNMRPVPRPSGALKVKPVSTPRIGLASLQTAPFEGDGTTDAAWAVSVELPDGKLRLLADGVTRGGARVVPAEVGEEYGRKAKRGALVDAFAALAAQRSIFDVDTLVVHCPDPEVAEKLTSLVGVNRSLVIGTGRDFASQYRWDRAWEAGQMAYARAAEIGKAETSERPLRGATDGSLHPHNKGAGSGWVLADGRAGAEVLESHEVLLAELTAIRELLSAVDIHQALVIEIDSREALKVVKNIASIGATKATQTRTGLVNAVAHDIETLLKDRDNVEFTWVRGHSGNKLNELADQLAVAAGRVARSLMTTENLEAVVKRVSDEAIA